jgi:hypothetical protein
VLSYFQSIESFHGRPKLLEPSERCLPGLNPVPSALQRADVPLWIAGFCFLPAKNAMRIYFIDLLF